MLTLVLTLLGAGLGLIGGLVIQYIRGQGVKALLDNLDTAKKVEDIQKSVDSNDAKINALKDAENNTLNSAKDAENKDVTKDDLLKFLNDKPSK